MASREPSQQRTSRHASRDPYQTRSRTQSVQPSPKVTTTTLPSTGMPGSMPEFTQPTKESSPTVRATQTQTMDTDETDPAATSADVFHLLSVVQNMQRLLLERIDTLEKATNNRLSSIEHNTTLLRLEIGTRTDPTDGTCHQKMGYLNEKMIRFEAEVERNLNEREDDYNTRLEDIRSHIDNQRTAIEKYVQNSFKTLDDSQIHRHKESLKRSEEIEKAVAVVRYIVTDLEPQPTSERTENEFGQPPTTSTPPGAPFAPPRTRILSPSTSNDDRRESSCEQYGGDMGRGRSREQRVPRPSVGNTTLGISDKELSKAIMKKPDAYNGKRGLSARTFMMQMETYFLTRTVAMGEIEKIYAVLTNMGNNSNAASWTQPLLEQRNRGIEHLYLQSWDAFRTAFLLNFNDPAFQLKASDELMAITQTLSVAEYASRFRALSAQVDWNDGTLTAGFKRGLKPHVRAELTKATLFDDKTRTFEEWATVAIKLDNVLYTRTGRPDRPDRPANQNTSTMDPRPRGVLVPEEQKELRMREGRCIKCGKANHQARECRGRWTLEANITGGVKGKAGGIMETTDKPESGKD